MLLSFLKYAKMGGGAQPTFAPFSKGDSNPPTPSKLHHLTKTRFIVKQRAFIKESCTYVDEATIAVIDSAS